MNAPEHNPWAGMHNTDPQRLAYGALCAQASSLALFGFSEALYARGCAAANAIPRNPLRHLTGVPYGTRVLANVLKK